MAKIRKKARPDLGTGTLEKLDKSVTYPPMVDSLVYTILIF